MEPNASLRSILGFFEGLGLASFCFFGGLSIASVLYFGTIQVHRYASILFVVGSFVCVYSFGLSILSAWNSRLFVRYHISETDDLLQPLTFYFMNAQLPQARRLEVGGTRHVERDTDKKGQAAGGQVNHRFIPCPSVKTWRAREQTEGGRLPRREYFEVTVDKRFQATLLTFDPGTRKVVAAGAGLSLLGLLGDFCGYIFLSPEGEILVSWRCRWQARSPGS